MEARARVNNGGLVDHGSPIGAKDGARCRQLIIDPSLDIKLPDTASFAHDTGIQHDLIPRDAGALKAQIIGADKVVDRAVRWGFIHGDKAQNTCGLSHGFQQQYSWKHWLTWKMAVEKRLIDTQVLVGLNALTRLYIHHPVYQQKRIPVGKSVANFFNVECHALPSSC